MNLVLCKHIKCWEFQAVLFLRMFLKGKIHVQRSEVLMTEEEKWQFLPFPSCSQIDNNVPLSTGCQDKKTYLIVPCRAGKRTAWLRKKNHVLSDHTFKLWVNFAWTLTQSCTQLCMLEDSFYLIFSPDQVWTCGWRYRRYRKKTRTLCSDSRVSHWASMEMCIQLHRSISDQNMIFVWVSLFLWETVSLVAQIKQQENKHECSLQFTSLSKPSLSRIALL